MAMEGTPQGVGRSAEIPEHRGSKARPRSTQWTMDADLLDDVALVGVYGIAVELEAEASYLDFLAGRLCLLGPRCRPSGCRRRPHGSSEQTIVRPSPRRNAQVSAKAGTGCAVVHNRAGNRRGNICVIDGATNEPRNLGPFGWVKKFGRQGCLPLWKSCRSQPRPRTRECIPPTLGPVASTVRLKSIPNSATIVCLGHFSHKPYLGKKLHN